MRKLSLISVIILLIATIGSPQTSFSITNVQAQDEVECAVSLTPSDSIQTAIDEANAGDVICLEAGIWEENISIDKTLELHGVALEETIIDGVSDLEPVVHISGIATLQNIAITGSEGTCDGNLGCTHGLVIEALGDVNLIDVAIRANAGSGLEIRDRASLFVSDSIISSNGLGGIVVNDEADVLIENSFIEENGFDSLCILTDIFCSGIEVLSGGSLTLETTEINNNADWGVGAGLERCGYLANSFVGRISLDEESSISENNLSHNLDILGNPGRHQFSELAPGQVCTQELFITNVQPRTGSEFVEITNRSFNSIDLGGIVLNVRGENSDESYMIPEECELAPFSSLRVLSGPASFATATVSCAAEQNSHFWQGQFSIPNTEFKITLKRSEGDLIDSLDFPERRPVVVVESNLGTFKFVIFNDLTPITAGNFQKLVDEGFYDGLIYHRIIDHFVIQGGDPLCLGFGDGCGTGGSDETISLEIAPSLSYSAPGVVGMARASDPNSASSQYFITLSEQMRLDGDFAIFGRVIDNLDLVLEMGGLATDSRDRPLKDVVMVRVFVEEPFARFAE